MKNEAKSDCTIENTSKALRRLSKYTDLSNPEEVK
jgi:hypothetical protein